MPRPTRILAPLLLLIAAVGPSSAESLLVVQPVDAGNSTINPVLATQEAFAQAIFGQIGLEINFLTPTISAPSLPSSYNETNPFEPNQYIGSSSFQQPPALTVWFVNTITNGVVFDRGLTVPYGSYIASWIADTAVNDTLAHEIANALTGGGQETNGTPSNLMEVGTDRNIPQQLSQIFVGSTFDQITSTQAATMLANPTFVQNVQTVPEPSSLLLAILGAAGFVARRRSRG